MKRIALACLVAAALAGCGGADVRTTTTTISVGQQLIDLKKAKDSGAMSEREYERARRDLINKTLDN
jgi:hypothetical protein